MLDGIGFTLRPGEALEVTGANGAGKSTLLRALAGLAPVDEGTIVFGETPAEAAHYLGHADALKGALGVGENLAFLARLLGGGGVEPEAALAALGLGHLVDLPAAYLSAGQRRRVALARLLVAPRPLWLLDEPTAALDAAAATSLTRMMAGHLTGGGLIVAATHAPLGLANARELRLGP